MFCSHCGKRLPDNGKFCPFCGSHIDRRQTDALSAGSNAISDSRNIVDRSQSVALPAEGNMIPDVRNTTDGKRNQQSGKTKRLAIIGIILVFVIATVCGGIAYLQSRTYVMVEQTFLSGVSYTYTYNEDGLCIKKIFTASDGEQDCETYQYEDGILVEKILFTASEYWIRYEYVCDSHGNIVSEFNYDEYGEGGWSQFEYDETGNKISETWFDPDGTASGRNEYEYDKKGNPVKYTYYDYYNGLTDDPYMVITYENKYDLWGNLISCTAWQNLGVISQQVSQYSYTAEYRSLSSYMHNKNSLDTEQRETHYLEDKMFYTDGYIDLYFSGLEATHHYLGSDDNFFEIDLTIVNHRDTTISISGNASLNGKIPAVVNPLILEPGDSGVLRIFKRDFTLDEDDITEVRFKVAVSDSVSGGENGTSRITSYGPHTVLNLTETVYFDFPVFTADRYEESDNLDQSESIDYETIKLGRYEQDNDFGNGTEEIEWFVLDIQDDRMLIVSRYALDNMPYNDDFVDISWSASTVRSWLNGEFLYSSFTEDELSKIYSVSIDGSENNVFLLNSEEIFYYFGDKASTTQTMFSRSREIENIYTNGGANLSVNGQPCDTIERATLWIENAENEYGKNCCNYWLRSDTPSNFMDFVGRNGGTGSFSVTTSLSIRPAIWIKLES